MKSTAGATAAGVALFGILRTSPASAAEFTYKIGHDQPPSHPQNLRLVEAAKDIAKKTNGRLEIQVYPNSQLGGDTHMLAQLRSGALEFLQLGNNVLANVVPAASLADLPFAYSGYEQLWSTLDGPFGDYLRGEVRKAGIHIFDKGWDAGMRNVFTSDRQVHTVADVKGLKLRVPAAPIQQEAFKALGASPTPINNSELYSALQTHLVDGAEQPLISIESMKLYEVSKYISMTSHQSTSFVTLGNNGAWQRLPKDLQAIVAESFNSAALLERKDIADGEDKLRNELAGQGQTIIAPEREGFRDMLRQSGLYAQWRDRYGKDAFALLEKSVGKLA